MKQFQWLALLGLLALSSALNAQTGVALETYLKNKTIDNAGRAFAEGINLTSSEQLDQVLDFNALLDRTFAITGEMPGQDELRAGAKQGLSSRLYQSWFNLINQGAAEASYRRVIKVDGQSRALVLITHADAGVNFLELIVDPKSRRVVDLYVHTSGENLSASLAKVFGLMMPDSKNFLKRLIGRPDINTDVAKVFQKVTQLNRQGRYQQSYQELKNLPQPVRESRVVSVMIVSFSSSVSDDVYQKELANLHRLFGDDEDLFLMMMDHYYFSEDYDRGITGLNRLNKRFNGDAAIEQLISSFNYLKQDYKSALKHINQAIKLEADQVDYYWFKADILIAAKQFAQTLKVFDTIRDEFGITADPQLLRQDEQFKDLVASPEFKEWEKQQLNN